MKRTLVLAVGILFGAAMAFAADQTWSGTISDSMCGHSHKAAIENQEFAGLEEHAGHPVKLKGEKTGDTIKVSRIEASAAKGKM